MEALRLEKRAFEAEREAYNNAAQVGGAPAVDVDDRCKQPIPTPTTITLDKNGARLYSNRPQSNADCSGKFDGIGRPSGLSNDCQEGYSGHSRGYVQDSVYVGRSCTR